MRNKKKFLLFALFWTVVITVLSLISLENIGKKIPITYADKIVHFTFYFLFVVLWYNAVKTTNFDNKRAIRILFYAIGYGIFMEICQGLFTTTRTADIFDVLANSTGAVAAYFILKKYKVNLD